MFVEQEDVFEAGLLRKCAALMPVILADNDIFSWTHMFASLALSCSQFGSTRMVPSGKTMVGTL